MTIKLTRPMFAACAKGSIFPDMRLTTKGAAGTLATLKWPPKKTSPFMTPIQALLKQRAQVYPAQKLFRLDRNTNALQQASRKAFPPLMHRAVTVGNVFTYEWNGLNSNTIFYLDKHPPAVKIDRTPPCPI